MTDPMLDHAAAHEWIADLALVPGGIETALASPAPQNRALAEHVAGCERCQADIGAWRAVQQTVGGALRATASGQRRDLEPIEPGAELRRAVLAAARDARARPTEWPAGTSERPRQASIGGLHLPAFRVPSLVLGLAAAFVVAIGGTLLLAGPAQDLSHQIAEARALSGVVASVDRILSDGGHRTITLHDTAGRDAGTVSWSSHDLVVLTAAIQAPAAGQTYRCWLSGAKGETAIGSMEFAGGTAYWVGALDEWASISLDPGSTFYVTLESGAPGSSHAGPVVLEGDL
jgi:hypothetical protein